MTQVLTEVPVKPAVCSSCRKELHLFMSHGMDHDGNKFDTPMYSPCQTCLRLEHMRGMSNGILAVLDKEER
jgi:hypothetical protein